MAHQNYGLGCGNERVIAPDNPRDGDLDRVAVVGARDLDSDAVLGGFSGISGQLMDFGWPDRSSQTLSPRAA